MKAHRGQVILPRNHQQHQHYPPHHLKSVQVLRVVSSSPQLYHSVRVDQRQSQAIHVLPEKYQFCALGSSSAKEPGTGAAGHSSSTAGPQLGRCRASVHYGLCTDFDVFVVQNTEETTPISPASTTTTTSHSSTLSRFTYSVKMPSMASKSSIVEDGRNSSPSSTNSSSTVARIERYRRENSAAGIGAVLEELLDADGAYDDEDEPAQLQSLIRNFVRQDRQQRQQQQQQTTATTTVSTSVAIDPSIAELDALEAKLLEVVQSATNSSSSSGSSSNDGTLDSKGKKRIVLKKPQQADLLARLQQQQQALQNGLLKWGLTNGGGGGSGSTAHQYDDYCNTQPTPFLSTSRDGVVQSRLIRFGSSSNSNNSRESSPGPSVFGTSAFSSPLSPTPSSSSSSSTSSSSNLISSRTTTASTTNGCLDVQPKRSAHHNQHQQQQQQQHSPNHHHHHHPHVHVQQGNANDVNGSSSTSTATASTSSTTTSANSSEKTVFGISPKSSSLSRYKNLIEQRATSPVPSGTTGENNSALTEPGNSIDRNSSSHCTTANNPSTTNTAVPSLMGAKNKYNSGGYSSTTGNSAGNSVAVLQNSRPSSATGIVSQVAATGYHHRSEPDLQITPDASISSLDSCHSPRQQQLSAGNRESSPSSSSSWKNQHYSNVNDTAKCIAVGGGGSTASSSNSSTTNLRYTSTNNGSAFTTSTTTTTTASSPSYLSSANSSSSLPSTSSSTTPLSSTGASSSSSSSFGGSSYQRQQQPKSATDSPSTLSLSSSTINNKDHQHQQRSGSPLSPTFVQHSPAVSPLTTSTTTSSSLLSPTQGGGSSSSSSIDTFIKENEQLFGNAGSHRLNSGLLLQRSVGLIEKPKSTDQHNNLNLEDLVDYGRELQQQLNYIDSGEEDHLSVDSEEGGGGEDMKIKDSTKLSSLTDDEKALLHETLKAGLYGDPKKKSRQQMFISGTNGNGQPNGQLQQQPSKTTTEENDCDSNESTSSTSSSSSSGKPSRRIILISKPAPKPEPKPEPKYVNGKVVFGQLPTPKGLAGGNGSGGGGGGSVLQRGSVAERVMLFEKCPEKTSVTKGKLTELQRSRALVSPNKIGSWVRGSGATAEKDYVKIPKIAANNNCATSPNSNSQQQSANQNQNHNHNSHQNQPIYQQKLGRKETEELKSPPPPLISSVPTFRRFSRSNSITNSNQQNGLSGQLPRFHFPNGRPYSSHEVETQIRRIIAVFERFPSRSVTRKDLGGVLKLVGIPVYWKEPLFCAVVASAKANGIGAGSQQSLSNGNGVAGVLNGGRARSGSRSNSIDLSAAGPLAQNGALAATLKKEYISCEQFTDYWRRLITTCYDDAARFMAIATQGRRAYLLPEDLEGLIQDVVDTHPGLLFLKEAEEFHSRYVHTVIARIFYCLDRTWSGAVSLAELRKSNLLKVLQLLEEEEDINQITEYFSYEHFYVIYCKFWELDTDHDLYISKYDLSRHNDSAISSRMIDRIFSGAVTRGPRNDSDHQMSYAEFVWFLLSEEDKRHPRAIEYWFRCMDLDGDGALSMYELEYFYSEQVKRMEAAGIEALPFTDCLCQMIDLASPVDPLRITLNDLKRCRLTPVFFDTFFNLEKYLDHEQRDPFASQRDEDGLSMSDWDRYAAEEYELLVAEENAAAAASAQSHASNRFYDYHHGGHHQQQSLSEQAARHRYHSEECLNLDEYDEEDEEEDEEDYDEEEGEEEETSSDSTANDYEEMEGESVVKKVGKNFAQLESLPSTTDEEEDDNDSEGNWSAVSNDAEEVVEVVPSEKEASSNEIDDIGREFYEYINAEFAPHGRTDVASEAKSSLSSPPSAKDAPMPRALSIKTPALFSSSFSSPSLAASPQRSSGGDRSSDFNNNPVMANAAAAANDTTLTALDDEDFW